MTRIAGKWWSPVIALALMAFCFSQLQTVAHIHHSHDGDLFSFDISFHPIELDADHLPGHHGGEEHHHSFDQDDSKRHLARGHRSGLGSQPVHLYFTSNGEYFTPVSLGSVAAVPNSKKLVDQSTRFKSDPRSPPRSV